MKATVWLSRAKMCTTSGKYTEAIDCYKNSLSMFHEKCDQEGIALCYLNLGMCYQNLDLYTEAVKNIKQCLSLYQEKGDEENTALCYLNLGECYQKLYLYSEAVMNYKQGLSLYQEKGEWENTAVCYFSLGECYQNLDLYTEAVKNYKQCLSLYQEKGDQENTARCYLSLGMCYQKLYLYSEAVMNYKQGLSLYQEKGDRENTAVCYLSLGECYRMLKMYSEAIMNSKYGLSMYQENGDQENTAHCYLALGECYVMLDKYSEAVMNFEQSFSIIVNHKVGKQLEGEVCCGLGGSYFLLNRYQDAKEYLDKALIIAKQTGKWKLEWRCYISLSNLHCELMKYREALDYAERALQMAEKINNTEEKQNTYQVLGDALASLGRVKEAIDYHERYLKYTKQVGDRKAEGKAFYNLSFCYKEIRDYDMAITYSEKSVAIAIETGDSRTQGNAYGVIGNALREKGKVKEALEYYLKQLYIATQRRDKHSQAMAYNSLGNVSMKLGKRYDAIRYYKTSTRTQNSEVGCENANQMSEVGCEKADCVIYNNLGVVYQSVGKYQEATEYFEQSLVIAKDTGIISHEVGAYRNFSSVYSKLKKFDLAREYQWKSIILAIISGDKFGEMHYFRQLGQCFCDNGNLPEAIRNQKKALRLALKLKNSDNIGTSYRKIGIIYHQFDMMSEAIDVSEQALNIFTGSGNKKDEALCRYQIGLFYYEMQKIGKNKVQIPQNIHTSEQYLRESLQCYEELFDDLRERHEFKISIVDTYATAYQLLALLLIETNRTREALVVCERSRACALGDSLVCKYDMQQQQVFVGNMSTRKPLNEGDLPDLLPKETCLLFYSIIDDSEHLWVLSQQQSLIYVKNEMEQNSITKKNITKYIEELADIAYQSMGVRQMAANCEDRSLGTQGYSEGDDDQSQLRNSIARLTLDQDIIDSDYLDSSSSRNPPESTSIKSEQHNDIKEPLKELFKQLITPVQEHLTEDEVVIIPEGPMCKIPFAALRDPRQGLYLCETKRIRLAPSLTTLKILKECPDDYHSNKGALVIGNPRVGEVMFRGERKTLRSLPAAETEADDVSLILGVSPLIGIDATKDAVKEKLQQNAAVMHIAAHGDDTTGEIALAPGISAQSKNIPEEEDYMLTMREVQEIGVRAKLVVLSCCHSGRGEIRAEGVVGMARAFLAAGARAVVASLWAIDDKATLDFMRQFYIQLQRGKSASVSLNESMKKMIQRKRNNDPKYWAPFFLIGDDVTIFKL